MDVITLKVKWHAGDTTAVSCRTPARAQEIYDRYIARCDVQSVTGWPLEQNEEAP